MKTAEHPVDSLVRSELRSAEMTEDEAKATWLRVEAELAGDLYSQPFENGKPARGSGRKFAVGLAVGVAAFVLAAVALAPFGSDSGSNAFDISSLESASASKVLTAAGKAASNQSLFPGKGERLLFRSVQASPATSESAQRIEEWIGPDGVGVRRDATRGASSESSTGGSSSSEPLTERFDANNGPDPRIGVGESWRAVLSMSQLIDLSTDPANSLDQLRRAASRVMGRTPDLTPIVHSAVGNDFVVLLTIENLLTQAPLRGDQREVMFELIETAPTWVKSEGSVPLRTTNLGKATSQAGQEGVLIETTLRLSRGISAILGVDQGLWRMDTLLDPENGGVLEVRRVQAGDATPYSLTTTKQLRIVGDDEG